MTVSGSSPGLTQGQVPTADQWNSYFTAKADAPALAAETTRAQGAEQANANAIGTNATAIAANTTAIGTNATAITNEVANRKTAIAALTARTPVSDMAYTVLASDRTVAVVALSAARILTLPAAAAYPLGATLTVVDESGACSATNTLTVAAAGSDTINGAAAAVLSAPYAYLALESNGSNKWTVIDQPSGAVPSLNGGPLAGLRNRLINGNFAINQRGYASNTALSAGTYAHDRWKAGAGGCTYTFTQATPDTALTITAGSLLQIVDGANFEGGVFTLSWTGTATARVYQGSASGSYVAGPIVTTGLAGGVNTTVEFGPGTLGIVQFEFGPTATPFERRPVALEQILCQRYYASFVFASAGAAQFNAYYNGGNYIGFYFPLSAPMRIKPTVNFISTWTSSNVTTFGITAANNQIIQLYYQVTNTGAANISNPANGGFYASAEL